MGYLFPNEKTHKMLRVILKFSERAKLAIDNGVSLVDVLAIAVKEELKRMKLVPFKDFNDVSLKLEKKIDEQFDNLIQEIKERKLV